MSSCVYVWVYMCECVCLCVCACVHVCVCVCVGGWVYMCECVCVCVLVHVCACMPDARVGVVVQPCMVIFCCWCDASWLYNNCNPWRALIRAFCTVDIELLYT